jgi:hypothetical protein
MDAEKLINKYIDVIEDAFDLGIAPDALSKMVWSNKTTPNVKIKVLAALVKFIRNKKNPRAALVAFVKSSAFKEAVPAGFAKQKKFFDKKLMREFYFTAGYKTLLKDLSKAEFKRFKFVEHIFSEFEKGRGPIVKSGIASLLIKPKRR